MNWNNITYRQLLALKETNNIANEEERTIAMMQAIFGEDVLNLTIPEFREKTKELEFLNEEIPTSLNVKNFKVNDREYIFDNDLSKITTAQYIDFLNYLRDKEESKIYAVFIIPKGHKYNDGYDMLQVFDDIMDMPAPILVSTSFFFNRQLETFIKFFQSCSMKKLKKLNLPKELKKCLMEIVENSGNLVSSHMY